MFMTVLKQELRNIARDKMYKFMVIYPMIIAVVGYFLIPHLKENGDLLAANILTLVFILLTGFIFGAITGFTLLDDQDDYVLFALKVTPISVKSYVLFKLVMAFLMAVLATFLLIVVTGFLKQTSFINLLLIVILVAFQAPLFASLINSFARNKVEGFVIMKTTGIVMLVPVAAIFITNWTELFLGLLPGFWAARLVSIEIIPAQYFLGGTLTYFAFGFIINLGLTYLFFKLYTKRVQI
jgi:fluoroquinolone transport system permease protein